MKVQAAVVNKVGDDYVIKDVELKDVGPNDVLVKIVATGICRSDFAERNGNSVPFPNVLGHEGSGIVEAVGDNVSSVEVGDHVIMTYGYCGHCLKCEEGDPTSCSSFLKINASGVNTEGEYVIHDEDGHEINNFFNQSSFATYSLVDESNLVKVPKSIDLRILGPLGCGLATGSGTVMNTLKPEPGSSIAIFGTGAVGFAALMAAKIMGSTTIIALDINDERLKLASELGATHTINSGEHSDTVVEEIREITNGLGVDYAIDTSGFQPIMHQALEAVASGGKFAPIAVTKKPFEVNTFFDLVFGNKSIVGALIGQGLPKAHLTRLIEFYQQGQFPFDRFIKFYDFDQISEAEKDLVEGRTMKPVLVVDKSYQPPKD